MIVFIESGRLGNQLFQYAALRSLSADATLVLIGFDDLRSVFDGVEARFPLGGGSAFFRTLQRVRPALDRALSATRACALVREDPATAMPVVATGLFDRLKFVPTAYFQSEGAFDPAVVAALRIKPGLADAAAQFVNSIRAAGKRPVFVHVRRGDYLQFPSPEFPAALPDEWYRQRMAEMQVQLPGAYFVFFSDDLPHVREAFGDIADGCVHDADPAHTFAIMCACEGGILSASSFAWWAAYFAHLRGAAGRFMAPRYWVGHPRGKWYPPAIQSGFLSYA